MSERCQIRFTNGGVTAQINRHREGYPEGKDGVIEDLVNFRNEVEDNRLDDPSYGAANFIHWCKIQNEKAGHGFWSTGYGVESVGPIHGCERYIYVLDYPNIKFAKIEDHDQLDAFDRQQWDFEGTLDEAYAKYVTNHRY